MTNSFLEQSQCLELREIRLWGVSNWIRSCVVAGAIAALCATQAAFPQSASTAVSGTLDEIIVTAEKREETLQDVPFSISAISGNALNTLSIKDAVGLSLAVPGLGTYQVSPGQNLLEIRGVSSFRGTGSLVGVYLDEIPVSGGLRLGDASGLDVQTFDLTRVEVLKGPQGTLFGEGAIGGVIRYVTNEPKLDRVEGSVNTTFFDTRGGAGSQEIVGILNVPIINDMFGIRIAGTYQNDGGWIHNISTGENNINNDRLADVRAKLLFVPIAALKISSLVEIHHLDAGAQNIVNVLPYNHSDFEQAVEPSYPTSLYNDFDLYNLTATYDLGFATFLSSTTHYLFLSDSAGDWRTQIVPGEGIAPDGGLQLLINEGRAAQSMAAQEFRLTSNAEGPIKWLFGGTYKKTFNHMYADDPDNIGEHLLIPGSPPIIVVPLPQFPIVTDLSKAYAGFADGSYTFFNRLELGGGVRIFHDNQNEQTFSPSGSSQLANQKGDFQKTTYRAFVKYKLTDTVNLYANTATGFRSGGFNDYIAVAQGAPGDFGPESSTFYEAGVKVTALNNKLAVNAAVFDGKYKNQIQDTSELNPVTGAILQYSLNAGVANITGADWDLKVLPIGGLELGFSGDYMKTKYTSVTPLAPVVVGDPIDFVPKYDLIFTGDYALHWTPNIPGYVNIAYTRKGSMQNTNRNTGVGYLINRNEPLNFLQLSIGGEYQGYKVSIFGRNLLNELGILTPQFSGLTPQARPTSIGISIGKQF